MVLPCARRRRAAERPDRPSPDRGRRPRRQARWTRRGAPGQRRHGGRRPRDRHLRPHRQSARRRRIAAAPAEPLSRSRHTSTAIPADSTVAVAGMGLVAVDVVIALTVGRGGKFVENGSGLRYRPSGREPLVQMFSRSGLPFTAKSVTGVDRSDVYKPMICTPEALDALSGRIERPPATGRRAQRAAAAPVRRDVRPLLRPGRVPGVGIARRRRRGARAARGRPGRGPLRRRARAPGHSLRQLRRRGDVLRPPAEVRLRATTTSGSSIRASPTTCARPRCPDGASPVKSAAEVFRIFRDPMRTVVEQGGLSLDSYLDFNADICSRIHRLVAGPPALRSRQFLALMDAGVLRIPYGPAPSSGPAVDRDGSAAAPGPGSHRRRSSSRTRRRRRRRDPGPSRGSADRRLGVAAADPALQPRPRQPVPLRRGHRRQRRPDARFPPDRHRRAAADRASRCSGC